MTNQKPHILLITTDEQHRDTVFASQRPYHLPGLDRLRAHATTYENAYTASPVCLPSRCVWMSGRYPFHTGCCSNQTGGSLPQDIPNLFRCLKQGGYHTSMHGKCHFVPVPYAAARNDITQEYEHVMLYYKTLGMDHLDLEDGNYVSLWFYDHYSKDLEAQGLLDGYRKSAFRKSGPMEFPEFPLDKELHQDTWVGQKALEWIAQQDPSVPQFTWVSFAGPHFPMDAPKEWYDSVDMDRDLPRYWQDGEWDDEGKLNRNGFFGPTSTEGSGNAPEGAQMAFSAEYWREWRKRYYANIVQIDDSIRKIIDAAEKKYGNNLMILFTSDHGDMMGNHSLWGKRMSLYEDVLRVPLIVRYPGQKDAVLRTEAVSSLGLLPTILRQAGCKIPGECDGLPYEEMAAAGGRKQIISCCDNRIAVIEDGFKLCRNRYMRTKEIYSELYDLNTDPHEFRNLWNHPDCEAIQRRLSGILEDLEQRDQVLSLLFESGVKAKPFWYHPNHR